MKIVIGGANGLLGTRLARALRLRGDQVVELVRAKPGAAAENSDRQSWNGASQGQWSARIDGADAVINLAGANVGEGRWTDARKKEIIDSRVDSTRALVTAMRDAHQRPKVFLCSSAVGFYGPRGDEILDESAAAGGDFLAEVCTVWESEARTAEALDVRTAMIRTGVVLAPPGEKSALEALMIPFKLFVGGHVGSGKQWFPWIHIEDEIAAFLWALDHPLAGPINLAAPGIVTNEDFSRALGNVLHRPSWLPVPGAALHLALGEFAGALTTGQRAVPKKLIASGFKFRFPDLPAALEDLVVKGNHSRDAKRAVERQI